MHGSAKLQRKMEGHVFVVCLFHKFFKHLCLFMQRKFLGNLFLLQALNWLIKPIWIFWIERLTQINLGDEWYGRYFIIFNFGLLFNILLDFGLNNYVSASVGRSGNPAVAKPILRLRFFLGLGYIAMVLGLGMWQNFDPLILLLVVANQFLAGFTLFFRAVLQGRHMFKTDSIVSVIDRTVAIFICAFFIYSTQFKGRDGILIFLSAQTVGYAIACASAAFFAYRKQESKLPLVDDVKIQTLIKQTAWFAVLAFAMSVFTRIDAWMIHSLAKNSDAEAGLYAQSFRLLDAALIFSSLISTMLLPVFSRTLSENKNTDSMVWLNTRIVLFVALPAVLGASFFGHEILQLLYKKSYADESEFLKALQIFIPLMSCFIPMALVHIFGTWLTAAHRVKFLSFLAITCMAVNIGLNFVFIPKYGAWGAAYSCLFTQSAFAIGCILRGYSLNAFQWIWLRFGNLILWLILSVSVFYFTQGVFEGILGLLFACASYIVVTFLSGIFWKEIKRFFGLS